MAKKRKKRLTKKSRLFMWTAVGVYFCIYTGVILYHTYKQLPKGISYEGELHHTDDIEVFTDLTYAQNQDGDGTVHENHIFDEVYSMIEAAEEFIVLDLFLMDHYADQDIEFPKIAETLTESLVSKKKENPKVKIVFITDPLNTGYDSYEAKWFKKLEEAGVEVVYTDLDALRDSMPLYSGFYRTLFRWGDIGGKSWIPNAMSAEAPKFRLASYVRLMNVKANHRKVIVTEQAGLVSSSNPHDASGFHGNVALKVSGAIINDLLEAEEAVLNYSTGQTGQTLPRIEVEETKEGQYGVQYLTEQKIKDVLIKNLTSTEKGNRVRIGMYFIAEPDVVKAITEAAKRGVKIELILDPNENSFGNDKSGLPNRPVVQKLLEDSDQAIEVRWYNTIIGQYHTKLIMIEKGETVHILNGSANLTERTLDNYNLENDLHVIAPKSSELAQELNSYFERLWNNEDALYTLDVEEYQSAMTRPQRVIYALQEWLKLTSY